MAEDSEFDFVFDSLEARTVCGWLNEKGGIEVWYSADLGSPGRTWAVPVNRSTGKPGDWRTEAAPRLTIRDHSRVGIALRRLHAVVPVRIARTDSHLVLTDASKRKLDAVMKGLGPDAGFEFTDDLAAPQVEVYERAMLVPLPRWMHDFDADLVGSGPADPEDVAGPEGAAEARSRVRTAALSIADPYFVEHPRDYDDNFRTVESALIQVLSADANDLSSSNEEMTAALRALEAAIPFIHSVHCRPAGAATEDELHAIMSMVLHRLGVSVTYGKGANK